MRALPLLLFFALICAYLPITRSATAAPGFLDDAKWTVTVTPDKAAGERGEKAYEDTVSFKGGQFSSALLAAKGFAPAVYKGETEANEAEFEVEQTSKAEGVANWLGEIRGTAIVGQFQWKKSDGTIVLFNFKGTRK